MEPSHEAVDTLLFTSQAVFAFGTTMNYLCLLWIIMGKCKVFAVKYLTSERTQVMVNTIKFYFV